MEVFFLVFLMGRLNPVSKIKFDQISHVTFFETLSNSLFDTGFGLPM